MTTAPDDRWAAVERHLRDGEARLAELEEVVAELARLCPDAAEVLAASALGPLRRGVAEARERLAELRASRGL